MPRKKKPSVVTEIETTRQEIDALQVGAKEMLERLEVEKTAAAVAQPSGVTFGVDYDFLSMDNLNASTYLKAHGVKERDDVEYRFVNTDRRVVDRKLHKGWSPVDGGKVRHGDLMVCQREKSLCEQERRQVAELKRLRENPMASFEDDAKKERVEVLNR